MGAFIRDDKLAIIRDLDRMYEQRMCAMARGLMAAPILLMIDEMSLGLAPVVVEQ